MEETTECTDAAIMEATTERVEALAMEIAQLSESLKKQECELAELETHVNAHTSPFGPGMLGDLLLFESLRSTKQSVERLRERLHELDAREPPPPDHQQPR